MRLPLSSLSLNNLFLAPLVDVITDCVWSYDDVRTNLLSDLSMLLRGLMILLNFPPIDDFNVSILSTVRTLF